jgi:hypothetical protein
MSDTAQVASHQTVRLSRGKHRDPTQGVCVMELASMLAGERFSDRPRSVCPVIGAFLRAYNDRVDDARRQDLYVFAAEAVGTRSDRATRRRRLELCRRFAVRCAGTPPGPVTGLFCIGQAESAGAHAALAAASPEQPDGHAMALVLLEALIACGSGDSAARHDRPQQGRSGAPARAAR